MTKKIVIFGAGNHAKIVANEILRVKGYKLIFFIDQNIKNKKNRIMGRRVLNIKEAKKHQKKFNFGIIAVGDIKIKKKIYNEAQKILKKLKWLTLISKETQIDKSVEIGEGTFVMKGAIINLNSKIGNHCLINTSSVIEHDCKLGNFINCSPRSVLLGNVTVKDSSYIGANCTVIENIIINKNVKIGANSLVNKNCKQNSLYYGSPVKKIKKY